jgi:ribonuclease J
MTKLTFYGGVNEIGGNKILVEDKDTKVFFDFGLSFSKGTKFYTRFLSSRNVAGAADDMELGILPAIKGLYSQEMLKFTPLKYEEPKFDAIFLTHAHMDHVAHIQYIDEKIPLYLGETTQNVLKSFSPGKEVEEEFGNREYKTFRTGSKIKIGSLEVEPFHVDHSIPGAYGFFIHTGDGTIVYTGDLRMHGPACQMTKDFIEKAASYDPIAMICEGTRVGRKPQTTENMTEEGVHKIANKITSKSNKLVITTFYGRDVDRIKTFYNTAIENDRTFVVSMKTANLLHKLKDDSMLNVPDPLTDKRVKIYARRKKTGSYSETDYYIWERPYLANMITYDEIQANEKKYLLNLDFYNFNELIDIKPTPGGEFIHSMSEPFSEGGMDQIEHDILKNWLSHFKLKLRQAHASGHMSADEIKKMVNHIKPEVLIPIHTENAKKFSSIIKTKVLVPREKKKIIL